jgi:hypothetical protein
MYLWIIQLVCSCFEATKFEMLSAVMESIKTLSSFIGQNINAYMVLVGNPEETHCKT